MKMSEELKQFYRDLQAWIDAGMPESRVFSPDGAICISIMKWAEKLESSSPGVQWLLLAENEGLFVSLGRRKDFPFNVGGDWWREAEGGTFYENPERLAFIKEMAK